MTAIFLTRTLTGVQPADADAIETLKKWKVGDTLRADVKKPRNLGLHKKAFALVDLVFPHQDKYQSKEALRLAMTVEAGYVDRIDLIGGGVTLVPKSWSFESMDDLAFEALLSALVDVAIKIIPGSKRADWESALDHVVRF